MRFGYSSVQRAVCFLSIFLKRIVGDGPWTSHEQKGVLRQGVEGAAPYDEILALLLCPAGGLQQLTLDVFAVPVIVEKPGPAVQRTALGQIFCQSPQGLHRLQTF